MSIDKFVLPRPATLQDALRRLQETARGIVLLVDESGRLVRTVTDGDVRRLLLDGWTLADSLSAVPVRAPVSRALPCTPAAALDAMNEAKVDQLPLVDAAGRPVELCFRRDLETSILLSTPHMSSYEREFVEEAFRTNWVAPLGPNVDAFEKEFAAYVGSQHGAAVVSGTAAIHLALRLLDVGPGDVVFCSSLTFVASANPILYQGATPVFVDSEPATWNMSPAALERALAAAKSAGRLPKAVVVVNLYGQSADMDPLLELCVRYGVPVVEDAAESLGATYKGRHSGSFGRIGAFSFNGNKIITTSGGGMLVADDEALVRRARHLSTQAREPAAHYEHVEVGYNYRMSNVLAGIGRGQLRVLDERVAARRQVYERYVAGLADVPGLGWMPEASFGRSTHWLTAVTLPEGIEPLAFVKALAEHRIEARRLWKPMHLQPLFAGADYHTHASGQDVSTHLFARGVCLPSGSNLTGEQLDRILHAIRGILLP